MVLSPLPGDLAYHFPQQFFHGHFSGGQSSFKPDALLSWFSSHHGSFFHQNLAIHKKKKSAIKEASPVLHPDYPSRRARSWLLSHEMRVILATTANNAAKCTITCLCGSAWEQQPFVRGSCCQVRSAASFTTPASSSGRHRAVRLGPASFFPSPPDSLHNHVWALQRLTSRADVLLPLHNAV